MERQAYSTALVVGLLVVVLAGVWNTFAPDFLPADPPEAEEDADTGPWLDPEYLSERDLAFLGEVLLQPEEPGRLSAARVLAVSGKLEAVPMLLDAHREGHDPGGVYCMAALEILRLQTWEDSWRTLLVQIEQQPSVDRACMSELNDRFRLVGGAGKAVDMAGDPDPGVRRWVAQALADQPEGGEALLALTMDLDPEVRRAAWLAWGLRDIEEHRERLVELLATEEDPEVRASAEEVLP